MQIDHRLGQPFQLVTPRPLRQLSFVAVAGTRDRADDEFRQALIDELADEFAQLLRADRKDLFEIGIGPAGS